MSVLIPVRNEESFISTTIESICGQRCRETVEFLFLEGRSDDGTRRILDRAALEDPRIRVIDNPDRQIPTALNLGLRMARGSWIARMDAHAQYPPNYLAAGLARLRQGDVASVTGPAIAVGVDMWSRRVALALSSWLGTGGVTFRGAVDRDLEVERGFGGIWQRSVLEAHGGWDERWPVNEDAELAARLRRHGGRILCLPEMASFYIPRASLGALARQYWRYGHYRAQTASRHPGSLERSRTLPPGLALALLGSTSAPGPLRGAARLAVCAYACALGLATAQAAERGAERDALALPLVFLTMHLSWGLGFLVGCLRFRPGPEAIVALLCRS